MKEEGAVISLNPRLHILTLGLALEFPQQDIGCKTDTGTYWGETSKHIFGTKIQGVPFEKVGFNPLFWRLYDILKLSLVLTHPVGWALLLLGKKFDIQAQFDDKEWVF